MVDQKIGIIVAADVTVEENDEHQLAPLLEQTKQNTGGFAETTVADSGYHTAQGLGAAEAMGADVLVAVKEKEHQVGPYHVMHFTFDEQTDSVQCPKSQTLTREGTRHHKDKPYPVNTYRCLVSAACPVAAECSKDPKGRLIEIGPDHAAVVRNRQHPNARDLLFQRQIVVERIFAEIKGTLGLRRWSFRGHSKVNSQWSLMCTAMNLRRILASSTT
jgi:transposase